MPPRRLALLYAVFGSSTALSAVFGLVDRRSGIIWQQPAQKGFARNLGHSAAIYTAQGDWRDVPVAERLP